MSKIKDLCGMSEAEALAFDGPETHDHHRASDDGMPVPEDGNEDDLGVKWGSYSDVETKEVHEPEGMDYGEGVQVSLEIEREIADKAIAFINKSVGQSGKYRWALMQFDVTADGTPDGMARIDQVKLSGTIDDNSIILVAKDLAMRAFLEGAAVGDLDPEAAARNMDI